MSHLKRLSTPWAGQKKSNKYIAVPRGSHPQENSLPLVVVIRDILKFADTASEVKKVVFGGKVLVDGRVCRDINRGVGLFDVISFPSSEKAYRIIIKNKPMVIEIPFSESKVKLCRITNKTVIHGGKLQLNLHDGKNIITDRTDCLSNDSVLIDLPSQEIKECIKFGPGCLIMTKRGEIVKIKNIEKCFNKRIILDGEKETAFRDFIVVGIDKPVIKVNE
jgi:small subunit ribosomal protein S4e